MEIEECIRRDAARENSVGEEVIRNIWNKYLESKEKNTNFVL